MENNRNSLYKKLTVIFSILFAVALLACFVKNRIVFITGVILRCLLFAGIVVCAVFMHKAEKKDAPATEPEQRISKSNKHKYDSITSPDYPETGFVKFLKSKLIFEATGRFVIVKDFNFRNNLRPGYHLALEICGTKLVSTPKDYDDVIDYKTALFKINLGYFDGCPLSLPENDNGIIMKDVDLQGKTVKFKSGDGYVCNIDTMETDAIECGLIEFVKWNENEHTIAFKCVADTGVNDVIAGKINLQYDPQRDDAFAEWLKEFEPLAKPGAKLIETTEKTFTRFGGLPDVPKGFEWPTAYNSSLKKNIPIPFLMQVDFSEINANNELPDFPNDGFLYVFIHDEYYDYKVLYFDKADHLSPAVLPESSEPVIEQRYYRKFNVKSSAVKTYPDIEDCDEALQIYENEPFSGAGDLYDDLRYKNSNSFIVGGWANYIQEGGLAKEIQNSENEEWVLLAQITSDNKEREDGEYSFMWGDAGELYLFIRLEDLRARNFENVKMEAQNF